MRALMRTLDTDRIAEYEVTLMDIDVDTFSVPDTSHDARVTLPSVDSCAYSATSPSSASPPVSTRQRRAGAS